MYLEELLTAQLPTGMCEILTPRAPQHRGCQLSLRFEGVDAVEMEKTLDEMGITVAVTRSRHSNAV